MMPKRERTVSSLADLSDLGHKKAKLHYFSTMCHILSHLWNHTKGNFKRLLSPRFFKFCAVGLSGVVVNTGVLYTLTELCGLFYLLSSPIAIECSFVSNFILNELWTWKGVGNPRISERLKRLGKFHVVYGTGLAINLGLLYVITEQFGVYYIVANLIAILIATLWNFLWSAKWTWRGT